MWVQANGTKSQNVQDLPEVCHETMKQQAQTRKHTIDSWGWWGR